MTFLEQCRQMAERVKQPVELDCGDNSCVFAKNRGGMRTNGGCRCFDHVTPSRSTIKAAHEMLPELLALRKEVAFFRQAVPELARRLKAAIELLRNEAHISDKYIMMLEKPIEEGK